jgi:hypothetical protein
MEEFVNIEDEEIIEAKEIGDAMIGKHKDIKYFIKSNRPRCKCKKLKDKPYCLTVQHWLDNIKDKTNKTFDYKVIETIYFGFIEEINKIQTEEYKKNLAQIETDIDRTFPTLEGFKRTIKGHIAITQLKNLLRAVAKYNPKMGYVQGMNFVVGSLLYHSCEVVAFWLFEILLNYYQVLGVYADNLTDLYMHCEVINILVEHLYPAVWMKMVLWLVRVEKP